MTPGNPPRTLQAERAMTVGSRSPAEKPRILVVDDESSFRSLLGILLEMEGFDVATAGHGRQAIDCLREGLPDLVLTDYYMPFVGGDELILAIRDHAEWEHLPIILMSSEPASRLPGQDGADLFLRKPFRIEELLRAIALFSE
ncbi:MAG: response regulator [Gemmatimonadales bacterium]|nr:MAG: response regulator [Gemmatimonadales bacterium]